MRESKHYGLKLPGADDIVDVGVLSKNFEDIDELMAQTPDVVEPVGTIKATVRTDLGEKWALCNGDHVDEDCDLYDICPPEISRLSCWKDVSYGWGSSSVYYINGLYIAPYLEMYSSGNSAASYGLRVYTSKTSNAYKDVKLQTQWTYNYSCCRILYFGVFKGEYILCVIGNENNNNRKGTLCIHRIEDFDAPSETITYNFDYGTSGYPIVYPSNISAVAGTNRFYFVYRYYSSYSTNELRVHYTENFNDWERVTVPITNNNDWYSFTKSLIYEDYIVCTGDRVIWVIHDGSEEPECDFILNTVSDAAISPSGQGSGWTSNSSYHILFQDDGWIYAAVFREGSTGYYDRCIPTYVCLKFNKKTHEYSFYTVSLPQGSTFPYHYTNKLADPVYSPKTGLFYTWKKEVTSRNGSYYNIYVYTTDDPFGTEGEVHADQHLALSFSAQTDSSAVTSYLLEDDGSIVLTTCGKYISRYLPMIAPISENSAEQWYIKVKE